MHPTKNDLSAETRDSMIGLCNARLADAIDLWSQTKVAHWNIKGISFYAVHKLLDEVAKDVEEYVDLIGERAVQLGGTASGTIREAAKSSELPEYSAGSSIESHIQALSSALAHFGRLCRRAIDESEEAGDTATSDIFTEIARGTDKYLWFVEAHIQEQPEARAQATGEAQRPMH